MEVYTYICIHIHIYIYIIFSHRYDRKEICNGRLECIFIYIYMYIHMYVYICIYIYVYIYIDISSHIETCRFPMASGADGRAGGRAGGRTVGRRAGGRTRAAGPIIVYSRFPPAEVIKQLMSCPHTCTCIYIYIWCFLFLFVEGNPWGFVPYIESRSASFANWRKPTSIFFSSLVPALNPCEEYAGHRHLSV